MNCAAASRHDGGQRWRLNTPRAATEAETHSRVRSETASARHSRASLTPLARWRRAAAKGQPELRVRASRRVPTRLQRAKSARHTSAPSLACLDGRDALGARGSVASSLRTQQGGQQRRLARAAVAHVPLRRACTAAERVSRRGGWSGGRKGACAACGAAHACPVALGGAGSVGESGGSASRTPAPSLRRSALHGCAGTRTWTASGLRAVLHGQQRRAPAAAAMRWRGEVSVADALRCAVAVAWARLPGVQWCQVRALRVRKDG